jgi:hypothetical protein
MQYDLTQKKIVAWRQPAGYPMFRFELFFFFTTSTAEVWALFRFYRRPAWLAVAVTRLRSF